MSCTLGQHNLWSSPVSCVVKNHHPKYCHNGLPGFERTTSMFASILGIPALLYQKAWGIHRNTGRLGCRLHILYCDSGLSRRGEMGRSPRSSLHYCLTPSTLPTDFCSIQQTMVSYPNCLTLMCVIEIPTDSGVLPKLFNSNVCDRNLSRQWCPTQIF